MRSNQKKKEIEWKGLFLPVGIGLGTGFGALIGNIGAGMCIGIFAGTTLNLLFHFIPEHKL